MSNTKLALSFRMFKGAQLIREETLTQSVIKVGKVPSAHLRIDDDSVSRMHAVIEVGSLEVSLIDLGSTRGTFVNGKKINKAQLATGDVITIGDVRVELAIGDAALAARQPSAERAASRPPALPDAARRPLLSSVPAMPVSPPRAVTARSMARGTPATPVAAPISPVRSIGEVRSRGVGTPTALPARRGDSPVGSIAQPAAQPVARPVARPVEPVGSPVALPRMTAEPADESGGAGAVEVAAMLGDSVVGVKHCIDPKGGKVTPATWGFLAGGVALLLASAVAFIASVHDATVNADRYATWTRVEHKPAYAFRPHQLGVGVDWLAFGGLGFGLLGLTLGLVRARNERTSPYYRIGTAPGVELAIEQAPLPAFPLVAPSGDDFVFNYGDGIDGELILDGTATPFAELAATGRARPSATTAGAIEVPIPPKARIRARAGQTTFMVSAVARPRRHVTPLLAHLESRALSYVGGSLAVHLGILAFLQTVPLDAAGVGVELPADEGLGGHVVSTANIDAPPPKPDDTGNGGADEKQPASTQMKLPSGEAGNPNASKTDGHMEIAHRAAQPSLSRDELRELVSREGILGSEGLANAIQVLGGDSQVASGFDVTDHNGSIYGGDGEGKGNFGGGLIGDELGGGCLGGPCGTIGTRPGYGKIGIGLPHGGFGPPGIGFPPGRRHQALVPGDQPTILNPSPTYDKTIVRRYIHRHLNEISYCYEKQLLAHPNLGGEIKVEFLIGATGTVQSASGSGFDGEVASCLAGVVKTIEFPAPHDAIQVSYPFHFHAPGQ